MVRVAAVYLGTAWFAVEVVKPERDFWSAPLGSTCCGRLPHIGASRRTGLLMDLRNDTGTIAHVGTPTRSADSGRSRSYRRCSPREPLSPGPSAVGLGPLSGKQFAIYGGSIAVGLAALLGGVLILTRRHGKQAKDEVKPVPCLAAAGAIDMTATVPRIAVLPFANVSGDTAQDYFATASRRTSSPDCHASAISSSFQATRALPTRTSR